MDRLALKCSAAAVLFALCIAPAQAAPKLFTPGDVVYHSATGGPGRTPITVHHPQSVWPPQVTGSGASTGVKLQGAARVVLPGAELAVQYERQAAAKVLAKGAATLMLRSIPAVALTSLAIYGLQRTLDGWEADVPGPNLSGLVFFRWWPSSGDCLSPTEQCTYEQVIQSFIDARIGGSYLNIEITQDHAIPDPGTIGSTTVQFGGGKYRYLTSVVGGTTAWVENVNLPDFGVQRKAPMGDPESRPATRQDIEDAVEEHLKNHPEDIPTVVKEIADNGLDWNELGAGPIDTSGPASVPGPVTTSTRQSDAGTTTEEAEITYHITYEGNEVGITKTTTTTITHPDSSTETISETVDFPQTGGGEPVEPPTDFCVEHPNASACEPLGDNDGEDPELPEDERSVVFDKKMSATGSCPSPITFTIHGQSYSLEYTPLCTLASGVRPVVLGLGWLSAGIFLFGTLRNS